MGLSQGVNGAQAQPGVCTSTTRPPSPFIGQIIFETDTNILRVFKSDGWSTGTQILPITVPLAPLSLSATAGNAQVVLSWSTPSSDGGTNITDYKIYVTPSGGSTTVFSDGVSTSTTATVTGLANSTAHTFGVVAVNAIGEGAVATVTSTPIPPITPSVEYLVVAGGGGGSGGTAGGGGAGGMLTGSTAISAGTYSFTIGSGGAGAGSTAAGSNGVNTTAFGLTAIGGGRSATSNPSTAAGSGGSGGGGAYYPGYGNNGGGAGTAGQGNNGGPQIIGDGSTSGGCGGGGAGGTTANVNGGAGLASSITGVSVFVAGGGGGTANNSGGSGGSGGGGNGSGGTASPGSANTGGGGGGGWLYSGGIGGAGGSGVVVIAYPSTFPAAVSVTGSPTVDTTTRAGYRVYRWTGSGSITF